jgi:hypothetical protein
VREPESVVIAVDVEGLKWVVYNMAANVAMPIDDEAI